MQLSDHFSLEEMIASEYATRNHINNTPPPDVEDKLKITCANLEKVRAVLLRPLIISSGYRSPELNRAIGGAKDSAHVLGYAADFICPRFGTPKEIAEKLIKPENSLKFDKIIMEGTWVHISFAPRLRGQVMTAQFSSGAPTMYSLGII